jgi:hypothetical protein
MAKYTIFGGGPSGLYTAWRLLSGKRSGVGALMAGDTVEIVEWGNYDYNSDGNGDRNPAGRICSYHYQQNPNQSYIEVGGMIFIKWYADNKPYEGHQLVTLTVEAMGLNDKVIQFNTTDNPLMFLRGQHFYEQDLGNEVQGQMVIAPYDTPGNNVKPASTLISNISGLITGDQQVSTRVQQCQYYASGTLAANFNSFVYDSVDTASNIGYWNVFYDQAGNEGFQYAADAGGYSSNVINWNAGNAAVYNGEFSPGGAFKTLKTGLSDLFVKLYQKCVTEAAASGATFTMIKNSRLHSIWVENGITQYQLGNSGTPEQPNPNVLNTDYAFLAMSPNAINLVAGATQYLAQSTNRNNFLNNKQVQNYLQSVIEQPSFKVAMFFDKPWWQDASVKYPPKLTNTSPGVDGNIFGPTITDLPLRQVYYFGDNAVTPDPDNSVYGILASYDDMRFTKFWQEMELSVTEQRETPLTLDFQPLHGAKQVTPSMERMLLLQLAKVHWGDPDEANNIPHPLETVFMDWGLNPFGAGYHAWGAHYNICDVMQNIRTPAKMAGETQTNVFIVGSAFSNDQAWIEGAFCTAESVLVDYLQFDTFAQNTTDYPLICGCSTSRS